MNAAGSPPRIAVVIVNHDDNDAVLSQLTAHACEREPMEHIDWLVIHNGAGPSPNLERWRKGVSRAMSIQLLTTANKGYGAAINDAHRRTNSDYLLALNADILPRPGFWRRLGEVVAELSTPGAARVGVVGFRLFNPEGTFQGSAGQFPTLSRILAGMMRPRAERKYLSLPLDRPSDVDWLTGADLLLRRECLRDLEGFDERYFMYYEDVDYCRRSRSAGWRVVYDPRPELVHFHPYHGRPLTHLMVCQARHGLLFYFWKHRPNWEFNVLGQIMLSECRARQCVGSHASRRRWGVVHSILKRSFRDPEAPLTGLDELATTV